MKLHIIKPSAASSASTVFLQQYRSFVFLPKILSWPSV